VERFTEGGVITSTEKTGKWISGKVGETPSLKATVDMKVHPAPAEKKKRTGYQSKYKDAAPHNRVPGKELSGGTDLDNNADSTAWCEKVDFREFYTL